VQKIRKITHTALLTTFFGLAAILPGMAKATTVEFQTVLGSFEVNLTDEATPETVANFLVYVNNSDYTNSIFHRSVADFVVQGGGFVYDGVTPIIDIETNDPVVNEPEFSNVRGTIAMAKIDGDPDSANSQWFINLADNSDSLDTSNGGFTVFGQVIGDGMDVVDAIAALSTFIFPTPFSEIPLRDYSADDPTDDLTVLTDANFVIVNAVVVTDAAVDTAANLDLTENTLIGPFLEEQERLLAEQEERNRILRENRASGLGLSWFCLLGLALFVRRYF